MCQGAVLCPHYSPAERAMKIGRLLAIAGLTYAVGSVARAVYEDFGTAVFLTGIAIIPSLVERYWTGRRHTGEHSTAEGAGCRSSIGATAAWLHGAASETLSCPLVGVVDRSAGDHLVGRKRNCLARRDSRSAIPM
jgi:hypothetical protein